MDCRRLLILALFTLPPTAQADLSAITDDGLDEVSGQAGLTLSNIDWTLNYNKSTSTRRGCTGSAPNEICNSIPLQIDGTSRYLVMFNATGWLHVNKVNVDLVTTPTAVNGTSSAVPAIAVTFPDAVDLDYKDWKIDKISVATSDTLDSTRLNENSKIIHFATDARWSFGPNTTAYFFKTP